MNVRELIEKLQQLDQEYMVVVDGYEGGVSELEEVSSTTVLLNVNSESYYGSHGLLNEYLAKNYPLAEQQNVVYLPR